MSTVTVAGTVVRKENIVVGALVHRGPDWEWNEQDVGGVGTIVDVIFRSNKHSRAGFIEQENADTVIQYAKVKWSGDGSTGIYRIGDHGFFDLVFGESIVPTSMEGCAVDAATAIIGAHVSRGADWQWGDQDAVRGGHIVGSDPESGWVRVKWGDGCVQCYRGGADGGKFDLVYGERWSRNREQLPARFSSSSADPSSSSATTAPTSAENLLGLDSSSRLMARSFLSASSTNSNTSSNSININSYGATTILPKEGDLVTRQNFHKGARVVRGPDWRWADQDEGGFGVLRSIDEESWARVKWVGATSKKSYRAGADGAHDLQYDINPLAPLRVAAAAAAAASSSPASSPSPPNVNAAAIPSSAGTTTTAVIDNKALEEFFEPDEHNSDRGGDDEDLLARPPVRPQPIVAAQFRRNEFDDDDDLFTTATTTTSSTSTAATAIATASTIPSTWTAGLSEFDTIDYNEGKKYAVLRGKTIAQDPKYCFRIKTSPQHNNRFYFINRLTKQSTWELPDYCLLSPCSNNNNSGVRRGVSSGASSSSSASAVAMSGALEVQGKKKRRDILAELDVDDDDDVVNAETTQQKNKKNGLSQQEQEKVGGASSSSSSSSPSLPLVKKKDLNPEEACVFCQKHKRNYAAVPCGHVVFCSMCTAEMQLRARTKEKQVCPTCQEPFQMLMKIFH